MINVVIVVMLSAIVGAAAAYIVRAKKSGAKCIGCPNAGCCGKRSGASVTGMIRRRTKFSWHQCGTSRETCR